MTLLYFTQEIEQSFLEVGVDAGCEDFGDQNLYRNSVEYFGDDDSCYYCAWGWFAVVEAL